MNPGYEARLEQQNEWDRQVAAAEKVVKWKKTGHKTYEAEHNGRKLKVHPLYIRSTQTGWTCQIDGDYRDSVQSFKTAKQRALLQAVMRGPKVAP